MLELKVRVININSSVHHEILDKCLVLKEYSLFIDIIRKYQNKGEPDAYAKAIKECIRNGILAEYLTRKGSELKNMLIGEYDYDLDIEVQREEAMEDGLQMGEKLGTLKAVIQLLRNGYNASETARLLAENPDTVRHIYETAHKYAPDYDVNKICADLMNTI